MKKICNLIFDFIRDSFYLSYWPGIFCTTMNFACLAMTFITNGSDSTAMINIIGITFGLRMIFENYEFHLVMRRRDAAFNLAMKTIEPHLIALFQREHNRLGLKPGELLTPGQLLALDEELTGIMAQADAHYKSLVDESKIGRL